DPGYITPVDTGQSVIDSWTVVRPIEYIGGLWGHYSGVRSIHLNTGGLAGAIQQTVSTTPGSSYRIEFFMAGHPVGEPTQRHLRLSVGTPAGVFGAPADFVFDVAGCATFDMRWTAKSATFTASSTQSVVRFESLDGAGTGPAIDSLTIMPTTPLCVADFDDGSGTGTPDGGVGIEDLLYYLHVYN